METTQRTHAVKRYVGRMLAIASCLSTSSVVWGHDGAEELGHHWEVPAYLGEIRLQLVFIAIVTCAIVGGIYLARVLGKRGARN